MGNCAREGPQSIELSQDPRGIWFGPDHGMHNVGDAVMFYTANVLLPFVYLRRNLPEESYSHSFPTWKTTGEKCYDSICYGVTMVYTQKGLMET